MSFVKDDADISLLAVTNGEYDRVADEINENVSEPLSAEFISILKNPDTRLESVVAETSIRAIFPW